MLSFQDRVPDKTIERKVTQRLARAGLGSQSKVTVLEITGGRVRLGFEVDADVPVHRSEVWERIYGNGWRDSLTEDAAALVT